MDRAPGHDWELAGSSPEQEIEKHTHAILKLRSGRELRFIDPRRFGRLSVIEKFEAPGLEPLQISFEDFRRSFFADVRLRSKVRC